MHFRGPSVERSEYVFSGCWSNIEYTETNRYLGTVLTEHQNYKGIENVLTPNGIDGTFKAIIYQHLGAQTCLTN